MAKTPAAKSKSKPRPKQVTFNIVAVAQAGRLQYEAILLAASLRHTNPDFRGKLFLAEPQMNARWDKNPAVVNPEVRACLDRLGAEMIPLENKVFGAEYPYGNKIEALGAIPDDAPFLFLDTDTLVTGDLSKVPFDFDRPGASMKREGTWPRIELYGPGYNAIWKSLYDMAGLDFESTLDLSHPDEYWQRYLYFNAGYFYYRSPQDFGALFLEHARRIRDSGPPELVCQELDPWLDQIALPLTVHALGGGRDAAVSQAMDFDVTCHYRVLPLLYARESDAVVELLEEVAAPNWIKKVLKQYEPMKRMIYQGKGHKARALFDRDDLPRREQAIRNRLKREKLWLR